MKNAITSAKFFTLALVGFSATTTAFAQEYKERDKERTSKGEYTAEAYERDVKTKDSDSESAGDKMGGGRYESADDLVSHCPSTEIYFDGACRDQEWVEGVTFGASGIAYESAYFGGETEMHPGNFLYRFADDTLTAISDDQVSRFERPRAGQSVSGYWVDHEWVIEEVVTDDGVIAVGTRYEPIRRSKSRGAWRETGSFEWNPNYDSLTWVDGEPVLAPLPYSSVENNCVEESAAVFAVGATLIGAISTGNWWSVAGLTTALGLAEARLLDCLGLVASDDPDSDDDGTEDE